MHCPADAVTLPGTVYLDLGQNHSTVAGLLGEALGRLRRQPVSPAPLTAQAVTEGEAHQLAAHPAVTNE